MGKVVLTEEVIRGMAVGKVFSEGEKAINSLDFHRDGNFLVTADDDCIRLYNALSAEQEKLVYNKKYGTACVTFTHHENAILVASKNGWDQSIRYLSLHDNHYLKYFKGHTAPVVSIAMSPVNDTFISASLDLTVRVWDLRSNSQDLLKIESTNKTAIKYHGIAFDPLGLVFASATSQSAKLFDVRQMDKGPFATFDLSFISSSSSSSSSSSPEVVKTCFSPDGKHILLTTKQGEIYLVDAFSGKSIRTFESIWNKNVRCELPLEPCFSPDAKFIFAGSETGDVIVWNKNTGDVVCKWKGHTQPTACVKWNPKRCSVASACSILAFWCVGEDA